jgi:palmitoyltransferase ZDHHC3/7/25
MFFKDICGIICAVMTWLLIAYSEFVVMKVMLLPSPYPVYRYVNMIVFNCGIFLAVASHLKSMFSDPGAVPKGNATKENIQQMGFREGEIIFKCPKCSSIKPNRAHHCSVCKRLVELDVFL